MVSAARCMVQSGAANTTWSVRWCAATSVSGFWPAPIESRMSRSVRMPIPACSESITTAAPTRRADIRRAASRSVCAGPMVSTSLVMPSRTFMIDHSSGAALGDAPALAAGPDAVAVATKLSFYLCDSSSPTASVIPRRRATPPVGSRPGAGQMAEDLAVKAPVGAHGTAAVRRGVPGQVGEGAAGFLHDHLEGGEIPQRDGGLGRNIPGPLGDQDARPEV